MTTRARCAAFLAVVVLMPLHVRGQEVAEGLADDEGRSLDELVLALPGRSIALETLIGVALDQNLDLAASSLRRDLAGAEVDIEGGIFDPFLNVRSSYVTSRSSVVSPARAISADVAALTPLGSRLGLGVRGGQNQDVFFEPGSGFDTDLFISLSQPLLDGFNVTNASYRSADHARRAAQHRVERARESLVARITLLYWSLAEAEAVEAVLQRSFELAEALLVRNQQLEAGNLIATVDVITARSGVALRRAGLISAGRQRIDAAERLVFATYGASAVRQLDSDSLPVKTSTLPMAAPGDLDLGSTTAQALERRSDIASARELVEAAAALERRALSGLRPGLFLDGAWTTSNEPRSQGDQLGPLENPAWRVGLRFTMPVGNRSDRGRAQRAEQTLSLSRIELSVAENTAVEELRRATRAVRSGLERSAAADEAARLAAEQLLAERRRLRLGLGDSFRLLETEENAVQAELESVRSRYDLARAVTLLRLARGDIH